MKVIINVLCFLISLGVYFLAPDTYSFEYSVMILVLYILFSLNFLAAKFNGNYFTFDILFLISMLFTNFIYPVFFYPSNLRYFSLFKIDFNEDVITKATALVLVAMASYFLGGTLYRKSKKLESNTNTLLSSRNRINFKRKNHLLVWVCVLSFALLLITIGTGLLSGVYMDTSEWGGGSHQAYLVLTTFLPVVIIIEIYLNKGKAKSFYHLFFKLFNKKLLILLILFLLFFLSMGDRGPGITIGLILIGTYSYLIQRIKFRTFFLVLVSGSILMTVIGAGRSNIETDQRYFDRVNENLEGSSGLNLANGLIINNRALYVLYEHAHEDGFYFGKNYIATMISVVPSMERVLRIFDAIDPIEISTSQLVTYLGLGPNANWGLGTNLIGGIYLSFGLIGVMILMFLLGRLVSFFETRSKTSALFLLMYMILFSYSIYLSRADLFLPMRMIIWVGLIYYLFYRPRRSKYFPKNNFG